MSTLVLPSLRTEEVPLWLQTCLSRVANWAQSRGWDHRFIGDEIFEGVPQADRQRVNHEVHWMVDLGRQCNKNPAAGDLLSRSFPLN